MASAPSDTTRYRGLNVSAVVAYWPGPFVAIAIAVWIGTGDFQHTAPAARFLSITDSKNGTDREAPIVLRGLDPMPISPECAREVLAAADKLGIFGTASPSDVAHVLRLQATRREATREVTRLAEWFLDDGKCRDPRLPGQPILTRTEAGIAYARLQSGPTRDALPRVAGEAHSGQILSALAEAGILPGQEVHIGASIRHVSDLIEDAATSFRFDEDMEWRVVALALYRPQIAAWQSRFGDEVSWEAITHELLRRVHAIDVGGESCSGTHALYALAVLFRVDGQVQLWGRDETRQLAAQAFMLASGRLEETQLPDGSWDEAWRLPGFAGRHLQTSSIRRLLITGHHLEWLALLPGSLRPSETLLVRAATFAITMAASMSVEESQKWICACSHSLRANLLFDFGGSGDQ